MRKGPDASASEERWVALTPFCIPVPEEQFWEVYKCLLARRVMGMMIKVWMWRTTGSRLLKFANQDFARSAQVIAKSKSLLGICWDEELDIWSRSAYRCLDNGSGGNFDTREWTVAARSDEVEPCCTYNDHSILAGCWLLSE